LGQPTLPAFHVAEIDAGRPPAREPHSGDQGAMLQASGVPYIIKNVPGAPLLNPIRLCGTMFGLGVGDADLRRHRIFETNFPVIPLRCRHGEGSRRTIGICGEGCRDSRRKFDKSIPEFTVEHGRVAMDIDWMTTAELSQAVPPDYAEYIGIMALAAASFVRGRGS
jgi:DNA (cytosine-5)-methyltransferase 1